MTTFQPETAPGEAPPADSVHPRESSPQAPTSVSRLNETIRGFIEKWGFVWVEGEITSWNLRGGNVFGRLKDLGSDSLISFRLWSKTLQRVPGDLKVGDHVIACVKADYFVKQGDFSFTVSAMRHVGLGDQLERLERLRTQLRSEGLFDPARKKPLPFLPHTIGLITGENSDAEKDVHRNAELRATLRALSPASTLARGYAIAHLSDGVIVRDASQAPSGAGVVVTVGRGSFAARSEGEIAESGADDRAGG
jgi:exodeoxyribonuclease VII large subunit